MSLYRMADDLAKDLHHKRNKFDQFIGFVFWAAWELTKILCLWSVIYNLWLIQTDLRYIRLQQEWMQQQVMNSMRV
jgi:hypothetical protein